MSQYSLFSELPSEVVSPPGTQRAIELDNFPFERISAVAEQESWRKEINRPPYHIHKWWAQRLGSVFRAILLGALRDAPHDVFADFYATTDLNNKVIFDPFMGSGTTVGEALKLGARAIGRDINPVALFSVKTALGPKSVDKLESCFKVLEKEIAPKIEKYYRTTAPDGSIAQVLYYFWVKTVSCPHCTSSVDLFSSYIFSRDAYPAKKPLAQALCPCCGDVNVTRYDSVEHICGSCGHKYNPASGPVKGAKATCSNCQGEFQIAKRIREIGSPPEHRMYAKMMLLSDGSKQYAAVTDDDRSLYAEAQKTLAGIQGARPSGTIQSGYNTKQVLRYCYTHWHQMFNCRQLLCIHYLVEGIRAIDDPATQEWMLCLLSGTLEFNNMFASFKGEGTGAVRHMFSHHILKPERVPLEANIWGTNKSSGAFSTLFKSRLLRAIEYCENPFEIRVAQKEGKAVSEKIFGLSKTMTASVAQSFSEFDSGLRLYLSQGDSAKTDIATGSVDAVITDPPFFDNVHYSELADFFHVWHRHILGSRFGHDSDTTRSEREVQTADVEEFTRRIGRVWAECHRVLKDDGLLVFSYHHSRAEGWTSLLVSLGNAGFTVVAAHPIKAEMSSATPKSQAKEPIDLDVLLVCRKRQDARASSMAAFPFDNIETVARSQVTRLRNTRRRLSKNDIRVIVMGQVARYASGKFNEARPLVECIAAATADVENIISAIHASV